MDKEPQRILDPDSRPPYEVQDLGFQAVLKFLFGLLGAVLLALLLMWGFYEWVLPRKAQAEVVRSPLETLRRLPPEPTLQSTPTKDIKTYLAQQKERLEKYGWVDQNAGIVHIPIERAIELSAERGLPARSSPAGAPAGQQSSGNLPTTSAVSSPAPAKEEGKP